MSKSPVVITTFYGNEFDKVVLSKASLQRCFEQKVFWNYVANLQENIQTEVWFQ